MCKTCAVGTLWMVTLLISVGQVEGRGSGHMWPHTSHLLQFAHVEFWVFTWQVGGVVRSALLLSHPQGYLTCIPVGM